MKKSTNKGFFETLQGAFKTDTIKEFVQGLCENSS